MKKGLLIWASIFGLTGVILGAFGAHGLKNLLPAAQLASFETGVRYQMFHGLAILLIWILAKQLNAPKILRSGWLFLIGTLLFSGSIYLLACRSIIGLTFYKWLGPITPIGGLIIITGWALLIFEILKTQKEVKS